MKIILAGGTGFIGQHLADHFISKGDEIVIFSRSNKPGKDKLRFVQWDGKTLGIWKNEIDGADVVINLAGKSINTRYTEKNKKEVLESRLDATHIIGEAIKQCKVPPKVWMNMSSATIYENSETEPQDEFSGKIGDDFSMNVCKAWEKTFYNEVVPDTRKIVARLSIVLGDDGGALKPFQNLAKFGLGGKMGSGKQMMSWVHIDDVVSAIDFLIQHETLSGIFNITSPNAISNKEFMKTLRKAAHMPIGIPSAEWMIKIGAFIIGTESELILKSRWSVPRKLLDAGFEFKYPDINYLLKK
jgi:uncharacterized protein (TIGR01777 family)